MVVGVAVAAGGCGSKAGSDKVAAEQLQKSYEKADAPIKQQVVQASEAFQAKNYAQAISTLNRVVQSQPVVDEAQKKAVDILIKQTREAIAQNPNLNSPELYKATSDLFFRIHPEN